MKNAPRWRTEPLVSARTRKSPAGRPRSGPDGAAVRALAKISIRASAAVLSKFDAMREAEQLPPHAFLELLVESYFSRLDTDRQGAIVRAARRRRRDHYRNVP